MIEGLRIGCLLAGAGLMLVASLGVLRLPDFFVRMHAPTKAATLGMALLLAAAVLSLPGAGLLPRALLALAFVLATAPTGAHVLSRAALRRGVRPSVRPARGREAREGGPAADGPR